MIEAALTQFAQNCVSKHKVAKEQGNRVTGIWPDGCSFIEIKKLIR
jgi:hypothetical protein